MCKYIDGTNLAPGWGCCACQTYNALEAEYCKWCRQPKCRPLQPDPIMGALPVPKSQEVPS